jgi:hypothetical protein
MGDSAPRQQPKDARGTGEAREEAREEASTEQEQESQPQPDPRSGDPAKEQGPQSKFHGNDPRKH